MMLFGKEVATNLTPVLKRITKRGSERLNFGNFKNRETNLISLFFGLYSATFIGLSANAGGSFSSLPHTRLPEFCTNIPHWLDYRHPNHIYNFQQRVFLKPVLPPLPPKY
jgi:hypothetical protein